MSGKSLYQAAEGFRERMAAATAQHAQQLTQERAAAKEQAADADDRLQDVKDLLMALQARFNSRLVLCRSCAWHQRCARAHGSPVHLAHSDLANVDGCMQPNRDVPVGCLCSRPSVKQGRPCGEARPVDSEAIGALKEALSHRDEVLDELHRKRAAHLAMWADKPCG